MHNKSRTGQPVYHGPHLDRIAFPLGGIGAGMISLEGTGALSQVSLRHKPDVYHEPQVKGDFRAFLGTATGYGTVGVRKGKPFVEVVTGNIPVERIEY
jgi:hypothetical protein